MNAGAGEEAAGRDPAFRVRFAARCRRADGTAKFFLDIGCCDEFRLGEKHASPFRGRARGRAVPMPKAIHAAVVAVSSMHLARGLKRCGLSLRSCLTGPLAPNLTGIAGSPDRRIAGSPDRRIAGSPDRRIAGSPDRRIAGSPDRRIAGSPDRRIAGSPDRRIAGSPDRRIAGSPDRRIAGSPDRRIALPASSWRRRLGRSGERLPCCCWGHGLSPCNLMPRLQA